MRVECSIEETEQENDEGRLVEGICATCSRCNHETFAFGTSERSVKRALVMMREECPQEESNFYVADDGGGESALPTPVVKPWWVE